MMELYRISPELITENLVPMTSFKIDSPFASISGSVKAKLTRAFNKRHEDAKLKGKKVKKGTTMEHLKFNPILEEFEAEED